MSEEGKRKVISEKQEDYTKQFTFHDEETGKDVEALYNPKEKDSSKAWKRKEIQCGCNK